MKEIIVPFLLLTLSTVPAHAELKIIGTGSNQEFDSSTFPPDMKRAYALMRQKCLVCHTMERTVVAVTTGIAPISTTPFNKKDARAYCNKMVRKPSANISNQDANIIVSLLNYMQDRIAR